MRLLKHQYEFCTDYSTRYLGLVAGFGAGKTHAFCVKTILLAAKNLGHRGVIMEPTFSMVKNTLIPEMDRTLEEMQVPYKYFAGASKYVLNFAEGSCEVLCLSAENYRRMAGLNLAFFGVDECDTISKSIAWPMWQMAMSRLRKGNVYQGFTSSTPEGFGFLYEFFVENKKKDRKLIQGKTKDNPFLPPEFIQSLLDNYPANLIKAYLEGEFVNLTANQVYYSYDRELNATYKTIADFPNHILHIGQDFNVGKCYSSISVIDKGIPYTIDEIPSARDSSQVVEIIKQRYPNRAIIIYPDASGNNSKSNASMTDIAHFKQAGFEVKFHKKNPFVKDRVNSVNALFCSLNGERKAFINVQQCPYLVKGLEQQVYDKNGEPDKAHDTDHPVDAYGYFIYYNWPLQQKPRIYTY